MCAVERDRYAGMMGCNPSLFPLYADLDKLCREFDEATGIHKKQECGRKIRVIVIEEVEQ